MTPGRILLQSRSLVVGVGQTEIRPAGQRGFPFGFAKVRSRGGCGTETADSLAPWPRYAHQATFRRLKDGGARSPSSPVSASDRVFVVGSIQLKRPVGPASVSSTRGASLCAAHHLLRLQSRLLQPPGHGPTSRCFAPRVLACSLSSAWSNTASASSRSLAVA